MKFYLAPMEGVTGYIYRNAYMPISVPWINTLPPFWRPSTVVGSATER